jgi:predicted transcriptional regulator
MSNQSIINPDNSKSYLKGAIDVTKLKVNNEPNLLQTIFVGKSNKYDRNLAEAANDPMGQRTREQNRLINQPTSEAFINAGIQAASEIGLGTLEGAGFLLDIPQWVNTIKGTEREFGNWFSDSINELKKEVAEDNPIYAAEGYHPTNAKWWASMIPSIATSASLMIPSMGGAKLMSTVGKLSTKLAKGIASNSKSANLLAKGLEKSGAALQNYTGVSAAVFSRMAEGTLEATEAGTQAYQKYMEEGMSMEEATEKAGQASAATFLGNMPLLALDLLQYNSIFKQFGTRVGIQAAENALELSTKSLARRTLQKAWKTVKVPITEGAEEGLQFGVKEESIKMAADGMPDNRIETIMKQYSDIAKNVLPEYFNNDEFLTSITLGAVGGKVFDAITPAIRRLAKMDNTVDEDLRSGKLLAPYYKTRKAFVDLLQQDEVKANEMLEAAKTDPKLNKLGELESFNNLLEKYNEFKVDPLITKNANSDLIIKERMNELIYSDLKEQLATKEGSLSMPEGIDVLDLKIDALTQLESYEMQTPSKNLRNIQEIRKRKATYIAEKTKNEIAGTKTTYKPKEGYSWGSISHRKSINHYANMELADIMASISRSKVIAYESESGSMYADIDRKIQQKLEKIEDLELLRGSEEFDTDEKYINFLLEVKDKNIRPDLEEEVNIVLDNLYRENIYDETHPINKLATTTSFNADGKTPNQFYSIYEANKTSADLTKEDTTKLRFRNLFSNSTSVNQLVAGDELKYSITPKIGTVVKFDKDDYVLYKLEDDKGFFISLKDSDTFELETSKIKPTDITTTYRTVKDPETNESLIILPNKAIVVGEGTVVYDRNSSNIEDIIRHDVLAELSNPKIYNIENDRRKELEKADIKIPAIKTIGSTVNLTPFTLGNKNKATRKEAARKLGLKERELVKLSYYEEGSKTLHSIPFMLVNGELIDTSNQFYDPEFDRRVFVKAQKYESQVDINNKIYNEINDRYNNKYLELLDNGTLTVNQAIALLNNKSPNLALRKKINELAALKYRVRTPKDIADILETISNKDIIIRKRGQKSAYNDSNIADGMYEIDGNLHHSTTALIEGVSSNNYPKSTDTNKDKFTKPGNTIDSLSREIFGTTELNRTSLIKKYKDLFSDETVLNDAITVIAKRKAILEKEGFTFISEGVILFSKQTKKNIAGETDLIAYDKLGNIHIMDVKTFSSKTYEDFKKGITGETLSKKDRYRVQLSAYADMFKDRTTFKVSGISVIPYILERRDDGIITGIKTELTRLVNMQVISDINPLEYHSKINNSAFEVLEIIDKTEGIITPKNIERVFNARLEHVKKELQESLQTKKLNITNFIVYYRDIIEFYNENKSLLPKIKKSDIDKLVSLYNNLQHALGLENINDIVIVSKDLGLQIKDAIKLKMGTVHLRNNDDSFFTIVDDKLHYIKRQYILSKLATELDPASDLYVIKSGNNSYRGTLESLGKLQKTYTDINENNVSAEQLLSAEELGFELMTEEQLLPGETYGFYSIQELKDGALKDIQFNIADVVSAQDNGMPIEDFIVAEAVDNNIKELTLVAVKDKVKDIEDKIENLKSLEGESLTKEKLKKYFINSDEIELLDNAEKLKQFYEDKLEYLQGQKTYYEQELFKDGIEVIPKEVIVDKLKYINRDISLFEKMIAKLKEFIDVIINAISNRERLGKAELTLKEKQNIKIYLQELLDSDIFTNVEQPEITDTDVQELKDLGLVVIGNKPTNLKNKGKFRKIKNKYIGKKLYISKGVDIDKFIKDVDNDNIIHLTDELINSSESYANDLLDNKHPDKIIIISNPNVLQKEGLIDNIIAISNPKEDSVNKDNYTKENGFIYDRIVTGKDEEFVSKVEFIKYGDSLLDFMTESVKAITEEDVANAELNYSFQYSGLVDTEITYNPYKDSTLVMRGDYVPTEASDVAVYGSFYPRIATDDDGLKNIIDELMSRGIETVDGQTFTPTYSREIYESLYKDKSKKDLFTKNAVVLVHKSAQGKINIVLAYKEINDGIPNYVPVGLMNTLEQSLYAYSTTPDDKNKPRAANNIIMSNFIRNEIEALVTPSMPVGKLVELDYDKINFTGARTTGLNKTQDSVSVSERINTDDPNVYVIQKTNNGTTIYAHNPTSEEYEILEYYKDLITKDPKKGFGVYYRTEDKLGNTVILPATLRKFYEASDTYKKGLQKLVEQLIVEKSTTRVLLNGVRSNEVKLQELINEIKNNYAYFNGNIDNFDSYDKFISVNNINNTNMVINYEKLQLTSYRKELMNTYLTTNIAKDPYVNTQYIFGITPEIYIKKDFDEAIEEEPLIAEGLFYEEEDKVKTNRFLDLDDDVRKSIKQPLNYETHYRNEVGTPPQYIGEIENSFNTQYGVTYSESFNEFVKALDSIDTEDVANVLRHIFKNTKNNSIKNLLKDYTSVEELILDYLSNPEKDFTKLKNYIEGLKKEINTNNKLIKEFYNKLDDAYFLDNEPELDLVTLAAASRALLSLAIQEKKLDFADPNKLISIIKGSTEKNFFLNELVLMLLEKTNAANLTRVVKLIKALRPDIQTIELTDENEFVLVKNTRIKPDSGKLYSIILKGLKKYGYDVNIENESYVHDDLDDLTIIEEEKDSREAWSIVKTFQFPTTTLNKNTKILLQSIISDDKDVLGLNISLNYSLNAAYAITIDKLVNSKNVDDLKKKMSEYSQSIEYIKRLKNYIDSSINPDELYGQLYVAIGNKIRVTYKTVIKDKNESVYPVLSNRQSPENIISTMLNEGIKTNTTYTSSDIIDSLNLSSKEKAQLNKIEVFKKLINTILERYRIDLKLYNDVKDDKEFYDKYKSTRSEYTFDTRENGLDKIKNQTTAKNLIKDLVKYIPKSSNAAHMTVEKTMQYQDTTGNFIGYVQNNRKEYFNNLKRDPLYETLPAIDRDNDFEVVQVIGYDDQYNDNGVPIGKLDNKLTAEILLSMHKKENSYPVPVPGDSGNMVFVNNIVPNDKKFDINKELYNLMLFEKNRIESIKDRDRGVKSYRTNGEKYVMFKAIDKILKEGNKEFNESEVAKAFDTYFNSSVDDFIKYLKNLGILNEDGSFKSKLQGFKGRKPVPNIGTFSRGGEAELKKKKAEKARIEAENVEETKKELIDFLKRYTASYVNITLLTINDPSYYPRIEEVFKRAKQNISPGQDMNMNASYTNPNNTSDRVVLNDNTPMLVTILNDVDDFFTDDPQYEEIAKALKSIKKDSVINDFDGTSETDGQAYIDPIAYRQRMVGLEEWTHDDQAIMDDLMVGKSVVGYNVRNNKVSTDSKFTTLKPYYYYNGSGILRNNDGLSYYNEPIQIKDSEMLITPYYGLKKLINKEGKFVDNPNYNGFFRNILEGKFGYTFDDTTHTVTYNAKDRKSDLVVFNSAVKEGLPIKEKTENASTEIESKNKSTASLLFGSGLDSTITLPFRFWKKQNETPKGHFSKESIYGTQLMKLIMADIPDGATFKIGNDILTKEQIENKYNKILITDVETSISELKKKYGDGKEFDPEKFVRVLQKEMEDDTINMQKALEFTFDENGHVLTNLPLSHPFVTNRVQPKTNAIFKNNVTVRKFLKGFKAANASSYGFENKPKIVWNKDKFGIPNPELGIEHFEVIAPIHDKKIYQFVDKVSGIVDMDALRSTYPELLEGLLYRIPTEDKYSMFKVKIIGFLPNEDGAIIMPSMVTTLSGMDFDIDKMFGFFKSKGLDELEYFNQVYFKEKTITKNVLISNIQKEHGKNPNTYSDEVKKEYNDIIKDYNDIETNARKEGTKANDELKASLEEYNKSLVSDNNKLDIMRAVLSHPTTLKSQLIPGGFKMIEEEVLNMRYYDMLDENLQFVDKTVTPEVFAAKNTDKKALLNTNARTFIDPTLWIDTVNAMNVGKDMTGIAANHNAARAIMQQSGIKLLDDLIVKHGNSVTNTKTVNFSDIYDFDGDNTIIKSFSIILAAVLDNGKNPLISYFGLNPSNANTAMAAVHLGYPLKSVIYFNKAYTNMLSKSILNDAEKKAISSEIDKGDNRVIDINLEDIIEYIKHRKHIEKIGLNDSNFNKELIKIEKKIYRNYYILQQLGVEFNDIVTYIQRGNRGGKPTFFENYVDIRKYNNYIKNPEVKYFDKDSIIKHFDDDTKFTTRFNKFIGEQNDEVVKLLSLPGFFNTNEEGLTSFRTLIETKEFIKKPDDKILGKLYNALYYKATVESQSNYFNIKDNQLDEYLNEDKFLELKKKYSDNRFINALQIDSKYEGEGLKLQLLVVDFKDKDQQDLITQDWRRLIQNKDPQTKLIGELLAVYSLRTTGYDTTRDSFNHLIPVEFYTESLKNYSKLLNAKIIELVNNPATGVNLLSMILSKYNYPSKTFSDNVNVTRDGNTKSISILNTEIDEVDATPLYYNVYDFNKEYFNDTVIIDTEEEDIDELGSELNPEVTTIQNQIVKLKELKEDIIKSTNLSAKDYENIFQVLDFDEFDEWMQNYVKDNKDKFKDIVSEISEDNPESIFLLTKELLPIYIDITITNLEKQIKQDKKIIFDKVLEGDIFSFPGIPIITTNLGGVHGAGLAQKAKELNLIVQGDGDFKATNKVVQLPVKKVWSDDMSMNNNMDLLKNSLQQLSTIAKENPNNTYLLPLAGLGHGEGSINDIMPLLINTVKSNTNIKLVLPTEDIELGRQGTVRKDSTLSKLPEIKKMLSDAGLYNLQSTTKKEEPFSGLEGEQLNAAKRIAKEFNNKKDRKPLLILGRAGTGKTYMLAAALKEIVKNLPPKSKLNIVGSALANAAKNQLADSLSKAELDTFPGITLKYHSVASLLNSVKSKLVQTNTGKGKSKIIDYRKESTILIVDEMSMLSADDYTRIVEDTTNNVLVIYAGDHGQLPPIGKSFSLIDKIGKDNILHLTAPQRQASGSPILNYLDPIWENATEQPKARGYIPVPNMLTPSGGIASINQAESLDNIVELYKQAIDTGNTNYVQFLSYENKYIKAFNEDIRKKIFGDDIKSYVKNEFVIFNDSTTVYVGGKEETVDNGTRAIIQEVLKDKDSEFTVELKDLRGKGLTLTGRKYRISYKLNNNIVETTVKLLDVADQYEYEKLIGAIEYLNGNFPVTETQVRKFGKYLEYDFGQTRVKEGNVYKDRNNNVEKTTRDKRINNLVQFAAQIATFADASPGYATTIHKSQGMTTDVAIYDYATTNYTLNKMVGYKTTPQDKKDAELLIHKANYTASSRAKHLMLIIDGNNSSINNEGSFVEIVDKIKSGTQEKVELTVSDKKSSTASTKDSKVDVKGTIQKTVFSPLYITKTGSKKENGKYKLKDSKGTIVELSSFVSGISYDRFKKQYTVGSIKYTEESLAKALGYKKLTNELKEKISKKNKSLNVYLLKKYTPPKESTKTTPPPSTRKPKEEKPEEVVIDMTKQFEIGGNNYIPLYKKDNLLYSINLKDNNNVVAIELKNLTKRYNVNTTNISVEKSDKDVDITRIKSEGIIYVVINNDIKAVITNTLNTAITYKTLNDTYFNKCK